MTATVSTPAPSLRNQVRSAVIWRSGTQVLAQAVSWIATFLVIRILAPADYGLYAMTGVVMMLLALVNGYGLANAYIQARETDGRLLGQLFGMLIVLNGALAIAQFAVAPLVAAYYRQPVVADMLRVQAVVYLTNPFLALGYAVLSRAMDFRRQAAVNIVSALIGAATALAGALAGLGVWTLVWAPLAQLAARALGMAVLAKALVWPSFRFAGAWHLASYGGVTTLASLLWLVQTQADVVIAGRAFAPHELGIYTTALFLAQIFVTKIVPPLNEVAFSAYSRVQHDAQMFADGFVKSTRIVMLLALPFCLGMAATAEPLVGTIIGAKWSATAPIVQLLALAMPFMTLHVLFAPATNAAGRPGLATRSMALGALIMPVAFLAGVGFGPIGIAAAWLLGYPVLTAAAAAWSLPAIGVGAGRLAAALAPPGLAAIAMALVVTILDRAIAGWPDPVRLFALVAAGGAVYGIWLFSFARERLDELVDFVRRR